MPSALNVSNVWLCHREAAPFVDGFGHQLVIEESGNADEFGTMSAWFGAGRNWLLLLAVADAVQ